MCFIIYTWRISFACDSNQPKELSRQLIPSLSNVKLPEIFDLYKYPNPKTKNELLHIIRKVEFYGMLQKTLTKVDRAYGK